MNQPQLPSTRIWDYKPWWCQPWSIVLTGVTLISGSWILFRTVWITAIIAMPILAWMGFFLLIYPRLVAQYLAETSNRESLPQ
ncbi:MAG: DUF6737 family protein [Elainellaceae cyanobacterium]